MTRTLAVLLALLPASLVVACGGESGTGGEGGDGGEGGNGGSGGSGGGEPVDACAGVDAMRDSCGELPARFESSTTLEKGCYRAATSPILGPDVTLTLAPGVVILFAEGAGLEAGETSALVAAGTAEEPICLTGEVTARGAWTGVTLGRTEGDDHRLEHVTIEYGGSTDSDAEAAALKVVSDSREVTLSLVDSTIRESEGFGMYLVGSATLTDFRGNSLTSNALGPASVDSQVAGVLDATSSYVGNDVDEIAVRSYALSKNLTWAAIDVPYHIDASLRVEGPWTIEAPNTLVMSEGVEINVDGDVAGVHAVGSSAAPIVFTGAEKTRGFWQALNVNGSNNAANVLEHVTVEYGGSTTSDADGACIKATADSHGVTLSLSNTTVHGCEGFGLYLAGSATAPTFTGNTFTDNGLGPVSVSSRRVHLLDAESSYLDNDIDRIRVRDDRVTEAVTWKALGLPYQLESYIHVDLVWTLEPGVTLMLPEDGWIHVNGDESALHAVGTTAAPITITGVEPMPGYWHSIVFGSSLNAANAIDNAIIEYGGSTGGGGEAGMITAVSDSHGVVLSVTDSVIRHSGQWGIWLGGYAQYNSDIESSNSFTGNAAGNVFFPP